MKPLVGTTSPLSAGPLLGPEACRHGSGARRRRLLGALAGMACLVLGLPASTAQSAQINCTVTFKVDPTTKLVLAPPTREQIACSDAKLGDLFFAQFQLLGTFNNVVGKTEAAAANALDSDANFGDWGDYTYGGRPPATGNPAVFRFTAPGIIPVPLRVEVHTWFLPEERVVYRFTIGQAVAAPAVNKWLQKLDATQNWSTVPVQMEIRIRPNADDTGFAVVDGLPPDVLAPAAAAGVVGAAELAQRGATDNFDQQNQMAKRIRDRLGLVFPTSGADEKNRFNVVVSFVTKLPLVSAGAEKDFTATITLPGRQDGYRVRIAALEIGDEVQPIDQVLKKFQPKSPVTDRGGPPTAKRPAVAPISTAGEVAFKKSLQAHETELADVLLHTTPLAPPRFVSNGERTELLKQLGGEERVASANDDNQPGATGGTKAPGSAANPLGVAVTYAPRTVRIDSSLHYTPEQNLTGELTGSSNNLFLRGDAAELSVDGGDGTRDASLSYDWPWGPRDDSGIAKNTAEAGAAYTFDHDVLMGQAAAAHAAEEIESLYLRDSVRLAASARAELKFRLTAGAEKASLNSAAPLFATAPGGQGILAAAGFQGDLAPVPAEDKTAHGWLARHTEAHVLAEGKQVWESRDRSYHTAYFDADVEVFSGAAEARNVYGQIAVGAGLASRETPAHALFRLGGDARLRGLEEGELVGRNYAFARLELGAGLGYLMDAFGPKTAGTAAAPSPPIFILGFAEAGRIDGTEAFVDSGSRRTAAQSLGGGIRAPVQTPGGNGPMSVNLGYAWSRQSIKHSGRTFTSVGLSFRY